MKHLADQAGTAGNNSAPTNSTPKKSKLSAAASFMAATVLSMSMILTGSTSALANTDTAQPSSLTKHANSNFKNTPPLTIDPKWTVRMTGRVDTTSAQKVIKRLRHLNAIDPKKEITMIINSPGGSVSDGLAIYDVMRSINNDVRTVCEGMAASMGSVLLAGGTAGKRYAYENCHVLLHEVSSSSRGKITEMKADALSADRFNEQLVNILSRHSGLSPKVLHSIMTIDLWLDGGKEAKALGIVDHIIPSKPMKDAAPRALPPEFCSHLDRQNLRVCPEPE